MGASRCGISFLLPHTLIYSFAEVNDLLGVYFSVLDPDRHPSALALLAVASALGTAGGVCVYRQYSAFVQNPVIEKGLAAVMLGVILILFFLGFSKAGKVCIPVLFLFFSALASSLVFPLLDEERKILSWSTGLRLSGLALIFVSAFLISAQAMIYSRRFSGSRHTSRSFQHRASYFLSFILMSLISAAGVGCLFIL